MLQAIQHIDKLHRELLDKEENNTPRPFLYVNQYRYIPNYIKFKRNGVGIYRGVHWEFMTSSQAEQQGMRSLDTESDFNQKPTIGVLGIEYTNKRPCIGFEFLNIRRGGGMLMWKS